jgi:glutamate-1-semialdehyde 2,1-aminomutase
MRRGGVNLAPSAYECAFTSFAHTEEDYDRYLSAARAAQL